MAQKYNVDHYIGTQYLIDDENKFTGEIVPMWESESKNKVIEEYVRKLDIDLDLSYSYGDTTGDFAMLSMVGNPVLINPIKKLVELFQADENLKAKAKIIVERKDVIYQIPADVEIL
jgi:phosphoserine phosphatase